MIDIKKIRSDFPILSRKINGKDLVYFDNAATSQTPKQVIDVINEIAPEHLELNIKNYKKLIN